MPIKEYTVSTWAAFMSTVARLTNELNRGRPKNEREIWFRGHQKSEYALLPSIYREFKDPDRRDSKDAWQLERDLFWDFSTRARQVHGTNMSDWDILFAMQHHGVPTRLLDWTESLGVAVYFAIDPGRHPTPDAVGAAELSPCIWLLQPYAWNNETDIWIPERLGYDVDEDETYTYGELLLYDEATALGKDWEEPVALYPRLQTDRLHAQLGKFTIHGGIHQPMELIKGAHTDLRRICLKGKAIGEALEFLHHAGINRYSLFPDLDNLALHLKERYDLRTVRPLLTARALEADLNPKRVKNSPRRRARPAS